MSAAENAGDPHYLPDGGASRQIGADEIVLLDLWGKLDKPGAVFADITWMGFTGSHAPRAITSGRSHAVAAARDAAVALVQTRARAGRDVRGWEVDRAASSGPARGRLRSATSCTGPVTASARRCTAPA